GLVRVLAEIHVNLDRSGGSSKGARQYGAAGGLGRHHHSYRNTGTAGLEPESAATNSRETASWREPAGSSRDDRYDSWEHERRTRADGPLGDWCADQTEEGR